MSSSSSRPFTLAMPEDHARYQTRRGHGAWALIDLAQLRRMLERYLIHPDLALERLQTGATIRSDRPGSGSEFVFFRRLPTAAELELTRRQITLL